ncbi:hypothetical protein [Marinobacter sp. 1_MG-2023]|uniref:hypothetical protein n=1 Tax=Marinobacter sp. 1_MG-2023 TaxID=3062627 RepID=UPI0026E154D2|nr:hypothetical protein [Marinobacter sp. 1_MG-2023]MDO6823694.1 hypothetical protein [Marinobacter sp. 1_MG-2023]
MNGNRENISQQKKAGAGQIPNLPNPERSRKQLGQDIQPVGDYAGIEPYYRVCEDVRNVQHQEQSEPEAFTSGEYWWDQRRIQFLNGKALIGLSVVLLLVPYIWGGLVLVGGGWLFYYYLYLLVVDTSDIVFMLAMLLAVVIWIPSSIYILIKTMPWIMGAFALLLRPFDKFLAKLLDRGLDAGESFFSRETGEVSFAVSGGKKLTAPFEEFDAYVERVIEAGGIFYRLMFVHRYTGKQFSQTSLSRVEPSKEEVMALWDMLQRYMDVSQPLPDVPRLEPFRHLDPVTVEHDQRTGRNPRFWRDLNLEAWMQGDGAEWLKRQTEYPWGKRSCRLTPQLGKISMEEYRKQRPAEAWPI